MHEFNPNDIQITEVPVGRDMMLIVTGGAAHIGAISTAYYTPEGLIEVQTTKIPGHKEYTMSEDLARRAIEVLNRTITIAAGIHYDNITKSEIETILETVSKRMDEYLIHKK